MIVHTRGGLLECCKCVQHFRGRDTNDRLELEVTDSVRLRGPQPVPRSKKHSDSFQTRLLCFKNVKISKLTPVQPSQLLEIYVSTPRAA